MGSATIYCEDDAGEHEICVEGTVSPVVPARVSGPADTCHPAEGGEVEIDTLTVEGVVLDVDVFVARFGAKALARCQDALADAAGVEPLDADEEREPYEDDDADYGVDDGWA